MDTYFMIFKPSCSRVRHQAVIPFVVISIGQKTILNVLVTWALPEN